MAFQAYGALLVIPERIESLDTDLPLFITEFGPLGHWEMPTTDWGREAEEPSGAGIGCTGMWYEGRDHDDDDSSAGSGEPR